MDRMGRVGRAGRGPGGASGRDDGAGTSTARQAIAATITTTTARRGRALSPTALQAVLLAALLLLCVLRGGTAATEAGRFHKNNLGGLSSLHNFSAAFDPAAASSSSGSDVDPNALVCSDAAPPATQKAVIAFGVLAGTAVSYIPQVGRCRVGSAIGCVGHVGCGGVCLIIIIAPSDGGFTLPPSPACSTFG